MEGIGTGSEPVAESTRDATPGVGGTADGMREGIGAGSEPVAESARDATPGAGGKVALAAAAGRGPRKPGLAPPDRETDRTLDEGYHRPRGGTGPARDHRGTS